MAQMVRCLLDKHEVLSSDFQDLCKKLGMVVRNCDTPALGKAGTSRSLGPTSQPASLNQQAPGSEREPCLKK